jgi:hypothetical protein
MRPPKLLQPKADNGHPKARLAEVPLLHACSRSPTFQRRGGALYAGAWEPVDWSDLEPLLLDGALDGRHGLADVVSRRRIGWPSRRAPLDEA